MRLTYFPDTMYSESLIKTEDCDSNVVTTENWSDFLQLVPTLNISVLQRRFLSCDDYVTSI